MIYLSKPTKINIGDIFVCESMCEFDIIKDKLNNIGIKCKKLASDNDSKFPALKITYAPDGVGWILVEE